MLRKSRGKIAARRAVIGAVALLIPALAGCEAGLNAPTLQFHPASSGTHAVVNDIAINNLFVLGAPDGSSIPVGGSAGVFLELFNNGQAADSLVGVAAPGTARSVKLDRSVGLAPGTSALLTGPQPEVVLNGLTRPLTGGQTIAITLDFTRTGAVTLTVPVEARADYYDTFSPPPPTPTATATPGATHSPAPKASGTAAPTPTPTPTKK